MSVTASDAYIALMRLASSRKFRHVFRYDSDEMYCVGCRIVATIVTLVLCLTALSIEKSMSLLTLHNVRSR